MRVLLDEQLPRHLAREIVGHDVSTVQREGWAGLSNGVLLRAVAERGFDAFVTADQNLQFQQNLQSTVLRIVVLCGRATLSRIFALLFRNFCVHSKRLCQKSFAVFVHNRLPPTSLPPGLRPSGRVAAEPESSADRT